MRFYKITFLGGLAIGYVLGAQAGRERYEQLKRLAKKAAESPAMQQTAGALQAQATATAKSARDRAADGMRKSAARVANKRSAPSRAASNRSGRATTSVSDNGATPPATGSDGSRPFVPANGDFGEHEVL
jgi:hypothetical protein